jgi:hypothetical protein
MKTQCPVASALFPLAQMHAPIMISPPMHGGGASAEGAWAVGTDGIGAVAATEVSAADAEAATDGEDATGAADDWTDDTGIGGAQAQARRNPMAGRATATSETTRRRDMGSSRLRSAGTMAVWCSLDRLPGMNHRKGRVAPETGSVILEHNQVPSRPTVKENSR